MAEMTAESKGEEPEIAVDLDEVDPHQQSRGVLCSTAAVFRRSVQNSSTEAQVSYCAVLCNFLNFCAVL